MNVSWTCQVFTKHTHTPHGHVSTTVNKTPRENCPYSTNSPTTPTSELGLIPPYPPPLLYPSQDLERVIETVWTRKSVVSSLFIYAVSTMKPGDSIRAAKLSSGGSSHHSLPENGGKDKVIMAWSASPRPKSNCLRDLIQGDWYLLTSVNLSNTQSENV